MMKEVFRRAAELISGPGCWTQGSYARSETGTPVTAWSPHARSWCIFGAIQRVTEWDFRMYDRCRDVMTKKVIENGGPSVSVWNDSPGRTQAEVVAFLEALAADGN